VFVVKALEDIVTRVQVKTANATSQQSGTYFAQFNLPWEQLTATGPPVLVYVLAVRHQNRWSDFIIIHRTTLRMLQERHDVGSISRNKQGEPSGLNLRLVFSDQDVQNKGISFRAFRNAFEPWPPPEGIGSPAAPLPPRGSPRE